MKNIMKDRHGWGLSSMFVYSGIILFFLGVVIVFVVILYHSLGKELPQDPPNNPPSSDVSSSETPSEKYTRYEDILIDMNDAALQYVAAYYSNGLNSDTLTISLDNLVREDFISKITDLNDETLCKGYVLVRKDVDESILTESYLKCEHYTSENYQEWREGN